MRKIARILIPALLLIAIVASFTVMFSSAEELPVVYVATNGTGLGDDPSTPIGTDFDGYVAGSTDNATAKTTSQKNALYRAVNQIKSTGGTIVLVGEVIIDTATSRNGFGTTPGEIAWPAVSGPITITSTYGGVDYAATNGAKLVLDHTVSAASNVSFTSATTIENIHIEYKYNPDKLNKYKCGFIFGARTNGLTIGEGVNVTSFNAKTNAAGDKFPELYAGDRYNNNNGNLNLVIKSGTWSAVCANTYGDMSNYGKLTGNSTVTIDGGTIGTLYSVAVKNIGSISGNVTFNINGGKVNSIPGVNAGGIGGEFNINIKAPAEVGTIAPGTAAAGAKNLTYEKGTVDFITNEGFDKVEPPFDPNAERVVYVSSNGQGNGKTPKNPIGNGEGYRIGEDDKNGDQNDRKNALYRAAEALKETGGVIVIVGDVYLDTATSRNPSDGKAKTPSEMDWPTIKGNITITSTYDGVDYAAQNGAKLILDYATSHSTNVAFTSKTTFENLNIVYKYKSNFSNNWNTTFMLCANGYELVIGKNVNVTSFDVTKNKEGDRYPTIVGGHRFNNISRSPIVTINSGTWETVIAGSYGMAPSNTGGKVTTYGEVKGNATLTINGGKIGSVYGTGSEKNSYNTVTGTVTVNVNGGSVDRLYFANTYEYSGTGSVVTLGANAKINFADYAVKGYKGDLDNLKSRVQFIDNNDVEIGKEPVVPPTVIYISAEGKGDGLTPDNPMGHSENYLSDVAKLYELLDKYGNYDKFSKNASQEEKDFVSSLRKGHVFYRAFEELANKNDGIIVLVGDVAIDIVSSRMPNKEGQANSPAEFVVPAAKGMATVTSVYDGKNYGGKLILDLDKCNTTFLEFSSDVTFENIEMVHKYDPDDLNNWNTSFAFVAAGKNLVMGEGIVVTSLNADTNQEGDMYPIIIGGHRYLTKAQTNVTVKSGTWDMVIAGGFGNSASSPCNITGNAVLTIDGGKIGTVYGTGSQTKATGTVTKAVTITVNGGEIDRLYFSNAVEYLGKGSVVTLGANAKINFADYAVKAYAGDLADLKSRVQFINNNEVVIGKEPPVIPNVIYVAANGTGDGSSPENPLGNAPGYKENLQKMYDLLKSIGGYSTDNLKKLSDDDKTFIGNLHKDNVLYRAFEKANKKDTVIVLVGDIAVDIVSSRMTYRAGEKQSPAEFTLPKSEYNVTITSVYGGQDYRNQAKFILDLAACNTTNLTFQSSTVIENINIEHRYNNDDKNGWATPFVFAAYCNKFVIGENVNVTSFDTSVNAAGTWYPAILGGHRYNNKTGNADVTIKSGTWSFVNAGSFGMSGTYGKITGNATLNIEGGKIEAVYGTSSLAKPTASITKKLTINITGGFVEALYATAKNGADNEIVVNIAKTAERVAKAWGGTSDANIPANATINYDRSVTRDDEVKYWTTVNLTGNVEDQPEPYVFTLYVANVAKGKGDGSSPENAMGHAADYAKLRAKALAIIKANGGTNSGITAEQKAITNSVYPKNAFYRALTYSGNKIVNQGGKIVVCGPLTIDATDAMRKSLADFWTPSGAETITITSYDGTTNFRAKGAKLVLDTSEVGLCVEFDFPVTFDNLTIEHKYNSKNGKGLGNSAMIAGRGNKITVGYNVKVVATDVNPDEEARVDMYPTIVGGHRYSDSKSDNYVIVSSGQWAAVVGGDWGSPHTGNATIGINGGKIGTICGTINPTNGTKKNIFNGSVWIGLWAGEVDNVYVVGKPGMIWGDASIGLGGTVINGKVRATHPDYEGDEIQSWVFNYTDKQVDTKKVIGFENPVPATGSALPYLAVVATVSLVGAAALIVSKKKKAVKN